jgi:hypothetical protein
MCNIWSLERTNGITQHIFFSEEISTELLFAFVALRLLFITTPAQKVFSPAPL